MSDQADIGIIGLGVMGKSLALNLADSGFEVAVFNRHVPGEEEQVAERFVEEHSDYSGLTGFDDLEEFVDVLAKPRNVLLMIKSGAPVDQQIEKLLYYLDEGDLVMDGGNSHFNDTARRSGWLHNEKVLYLGVGVSGGEEGARHGASVMPGGSKAAFDRARSFLEAIAATDQDGRPCCSYIGPDGAGHFVKMMHNGIEYAEMQFIAEIYDLLRRFAGLAPDEIAAVFEAWNEGPHESYLLDITVDILRKREGDDFLIDKVLDQSGHKGTGGWSTIAAVELGMPADTIGQAVMARFISAFREQRVKLDEQYELHRGRFEGHRGELTETLEIAYDGYRLVNHALGFSILHQASKEHAWELDLPEIARIWTNGCIIRSDLMGETSDWLKQEGTELLEHPEVTQRLRQNLGAMQDVVAEGLQNGYALPAASAALNYLLAITRGAGPANIIQAQRDYFGAHTYRRVDRPSGEMFHTNWKPGSHD